MSRYPTKPPMQPGDTNQRKIEIEPGVWVDYDEWQVAQNREKRYWDEHTMTDEERQANIEQLHRAFGKTLGRKSEPVVVEKRTPRKPVFVDEPPLMEPPDDWGYEDEPF